MRCKKHFSDGSSCVGVCASCLRERLLSLIDDQSPLSSHYFTPLVDDRCNYDPKIHHQQPPPPLVFPRSVSPYISIPKSDASRDADFSDQLRQQRRFFSTPQVDPTSTKKKSKFRAITNLFRSRSGKSAARSTSDPFSIPSFSVSSSTENAARRKTTTLGLFSLDETSAYDSRRGRWFGSRNRGMSPDTRGDDPDAGSPSRYSPEPWKRTPSSARGSTRTSQVRVKASHVASGIGVCLSPLMRPSPSRHWYGKSVGPVEAGYSSEIRSTVKPHLSTAASLRPNRSRKLADLGRLI